MFSTCPPTSQPLSPPSLTHDRHRRLRAFTAKHARNSGPRYQSFVLFQRNSTRVLGCLPNSFEEASQPRKSHPLSGNLGEKEVVSIVSDCCRSDVSNGFLGSISKCVAFTLFWVVSGLCPVRGCQPAAIALPAISDVLWRKKGKIVKDETVVLWKDHDYSGYTRRLVDSVSGLLRVMDAVKAGERDVKDLKTALKVVKSKSSELQNEILGGFYAELRELRREGGALVKRGAEVFESVLNMKKKQDELLKLRASRSGNANDELKGKIDKLVKKLDRAEKEYNALQEKIGEIEDQILKRETKALSIGVRELLFIERESELLVQRFTQEIRHRPSSPKSSGVASSRNDVQKDLEAAQKEQLKQMVLPGLVEVDDAVGPLFDGEQMNFTLRIKQALKESKNLQRELESRIRKDMKKHGDEKRFIVSTPEGEVVKGFPEVELKWIFGKKEVVVPKAISILLHHGWKRWREEAKANLKKSLLENADRGKQYVAERQERIILARDRVVAKTLFNEEKNRWEIDPIAVPYAVSMNLVEYARIRHDWGAMYIGLKGEDKDFFVNIKEFEILLEYCGGFDGLYFKMIASGVPTAVQLMWIPLSELSIYQQTLLMARLSHKLFNGIWNTGVVSFRREQILGKVKNMYEDIMMIIVFPIVEFLIPHPVRMFLGMAWPEEIDDTVSSGWYLKWQSEMDTSFKSRNKDGTLWYLWFLIRSALYGYVLYHVFRFLKKKVPRLLGFGPYRRDPNLRKLRRLRGYFKYKKRIIVRTKRAGTDPIETAFDNMKRVKNPPIRLKDFASIESMREEINEVVAFLQNPSAFQKLGARAPRGVLIVGEIGTGKTSLALAIAAEARVPVVQVKPQQLEAGLWVGQGASNVRELFQTARELAPVIIFVEDFDLFTGVRGNFIHTKKQDHEAFINQLLVELDGFEKQDGVVLMATTRNLKQIDQALCRPGRMDRIFHLRFPTQEEREKILQIAARETMDPDLIDFVDWKKVAEKTALLRPVDLKVVPVALEGSAFRNKFLDTDELISYCGWYATFSGAIPNWLRKTEVARKISNLLVNHLGLTLMKEDLENVVDLMEPYGQISNGIELYAPADWTWEAKFPHAVWAAGRGLIALLLPNFDIVHNLWLEPLAWEGIGCTKITKANNEGSMSGIVATISYLEKKLVFCFGSHIASQMLLPLGEENLLSASELRQAQELATRMVIEYGFGPDDNPAIYFHGNATTTLSMGNKHEFEMAAKIEMVFNLAHDKAKDMLKKNRRVLEKIVDELLEFEVLTRKDLERIMESNGGIWEKEPFSFLRIYDNESWSLSYLDRDGTSGPARLGAAT